MQISVSFASVYLLSASTDCDKDNCQSWRVKQASDGRNDLTDPIEFWECHHRHKIVITVN